MLTIPRALHPRVGSQLTSDNFLQSACAGRVCWRWALSALLSEPLSPWVLKEIFGAYRMLGWQVYQYFKGAAPLSSHRDPDFPLGRAGCAPLGVQRMPALREPLPPTVLTAHCLLSFTVFQLSQAPVYYRLSPQYNSFLLVPFPVALVGGGKQLWGVSCSQGGHHEDTPAHLASWGKPSAPTSGPCPWGSQLPASYKNT